MKQVTYHVTTVEEPDESVMGLFLLGMISAGILILTGAWELRKEHKLAKRAIALGLYVVKYNHERLGMCYKFFKGKDDRSYFEKGEIYTAYGFQEAKDFLSEYVEPSRTGKRIRRNKKG